MTVRSEDFRQVRATEDEVAAHVKRAGRRPAVERSECRKCGTRIWHSGLAVGSHRRACPGIPMAERDTLRDALPVGEVRTVHVATVGHVISTPERADNSYTFTGTVVEHLSNAVVIEGAPCSLPYTAVTVR